MLGRLEKKLHQVGPRTAGRPQTGPVMHALLYEAKDALREWFREEKPPISNEIAWFDALRVGGSDKDGHLGFYWLDDPEFSKGYDLLSSGGEYRLVMTDLRPVL